MSLKWTDSEAIATRLRELKPQQDPWALRFLELKQWVLDLPDFDDDPKSCNEAKLQAIQMAWAEEGEDDD